MSPQPLVPRMRGFGTTIFDEMSKLARDNDAVNLGQGFPDTSPPAAVLRAAQQAMDAGENQYPPGPGIPSLRRAVAEHQQRFHGLGYDPDTEVTVTFGATEALASSILALCDAGDEVLVLEPAYDSYPAVIALAGAVERRVPLEPPAMGETPTPATGTATPTPASPGWRLDVDRLAAAVGPRTRVLVLNSPHNPTGTVLDADTLQAVAEVCVEHDLTVITDEVYEHLVYDGVHTPIATFPGMRERTVTISSAGKTFSCTGWKVGWACAPGELTTALRTTKQFLSYAGGAPLQHGIATALGLGDDVYAEVADVHRQRRDLLVDGLAGVGLPVTRSAATYFVTADVTPLGFDDGEAFCRWAPEGIGVAAVPVSAFVRDAEAVRSLVRFAVCKRDEVLREGVRRLGTLVGVVPGEESA